MSEQESPKKLKIHRIAIKYFLVLLVVYFFIAYWSMPLIWEGYAHYHPDFTNHPRVTSTHDGHPGDPLNVALIGEDQVLVSSMQKAGWYVANPLGIRSDLRIAADTVLDRPYDAAPVSDLYLYGRKQDLAFEMPVGDSPRQRHHVRFWKMEQTDPDNRPVWIGAATFDTHVGLSHTTGQITHHIGEDVDTERDHVMESLKGIKAISDVDIVDGFHSELSGKNGGGDPWKTDGDLDLAELVSP